MKPVHGERNATELTRRSVHPALLDAGHGFPGAMLKCLLALRLPRIAVLFLKEGMLDFIMNAQ